MNNSSDSLHLDENLARLLAAYDQGIEGANSDSPTLQIDKFPPLPGEHAVKPLSGGKANEGSLGELLPGSADAPPSPPFPTPPPGSLGNAHRIGRFELRRQLGKGGCGIVFLAFDPKLEREVALKIPRPEMLMSDDARRRLIREAKAAAEFDHPNLVPVYETGQIGPVCFIATAFCPGLTLGEWLDRQAYPVPVRQSARLLAIVAEAVQHAHDRGVLHRDLKPNNVILQPTKEDPNETEPPPGSCHLRGDTYVPRVVDFGLAKLLERGGPSETTTRQILGTPKYMAPEQAQARHEDVGPAADVYALGVVLYEMLSGRAPYEGASDVEVLRLAIEGNLTAPRHVRNDIPRDVEAICLKAMDRSPARRYRTAIDLADDLRRFLDGKPTLARPLKWAGRAARWLRRNDQAVALGVVTTVAAVLLAVGTWSLYQNHQFRNDRDSVLRDQAERNRTEAHREYVRNLNAAYLAWRAGDTRAATELHAVATNYARKAPEAADFAHDYLARLIAAQQLAIVCPAGPVTALAVSPDGKRIATGHPDGTLAVWDRATGEPVASIPAHARAVAGATFTKPGELVTADATGERKSWVIENATLAPGPTQPASDAAGATGGERCVRHGEFVCTGGEDGVVRVWKAAEAPLDPLLSVAHPLVALSVHPENDRFSVATADPILVPFLGAAAQPSLRTGDRRFQNLRFPNEGPLLAVEVKDRQAVVYEIDTAVREKMWAAPPGRASATVAVLSGDALRLAVGDDHARVTVWNVPERTVIGTLATGESGSIRRLALSDDGRFIAVPVSGGVRVWATGEANPLVTLTTENPLLMTFVPGADRLVTAGTGNVIRVWNLGTAREDLTLHGHIGRVTGIEVSPDSRVLVSGSSTGEVKFWDLRTGQEIFGVRRHTGPVTSLQFGDRGRLLVTGSATSAGKTELARWALAKD